MNPVIERFEVANGTLRRNGLPMLLRKGLVFRALVRSGWRGVDGPLPEEVAHRLVEEGPFHELFEKSRGNGKVA
jgi:predicted DNA-binding transcriptional regulator